MQDLNLIISNDAAIQEEFKRIAQIPAPPCQCKCCLQEDRIEDGEIIEEKMVFECEGCKREMWYCYGQDDRFFPYCDSCWVILDKAFPLPEN